MTLPKMSPTRRQVLSLAGSLSAAVAMGIAGRPAFAQLTGKQTQGTIAPIPIAIPEFVGDDPKLGAEVADVISADLGNSGLFQPLDRRSFLEKVRDVNAAPNFTNWRSIHADALLAAMATHDVPGVERTDVVTRTH